MTYPPTSNEQTSLHDHYVTVREAAHILGVSERAVYSYLAMGQLTSERIGQTIVVHKDQLHRFQRPVVGRPRRRTPKWRQPVDANAPYLLHLAVRLRPEQDAPLEQRLHQFRSEQCHQIIGTVARYIGRSHHEPDLIQIVLIWRERTLPSESERTAALQALQADLADVLDWETACLLEGPVLLNT